MFEQQIKIRRLIDNGIELIELRKALHSSKDFELSYTNFTVTDNTHYLHNNSNMVGNILLDVVKKAIKAAMEKHGALEALFQNQTPETVLMLIEIHELLSDLNKELIKLGAPPFDLEEHEQ